MAEDQYGEMRAIEPNWLRYLAAAARKGREGVNAVTPSVRFRDGPRHEIGDFLFGQAPEVLDQAAHGFYPWTGRGQTWTLKPEALDVLGMPTLGVGGAAAFGAKKGGQTLQRALARALREEAVEAPIPGQRVFHGSPHRWDRPDPERIHAGEGTLDEGPGFYSTSDEMNTMGYIPGPQEESDWVGYLYDLEIPGDHLNRYVDLRPDAELSPEVQKILGEMGMTKEEFANKYIHEFGDTQYENFGINPWEGVPDELRAHTQGLIDELKSAGLKGIVKNSDVDAQHWITFDPSELNVLRRRRVSGEEADPIFMSESSLYDKDIQKETWDKLSFVEEQLQQQLAMVNALRKGTSEEIDLGRRDFLKKLGGASVAAATAGSLPKLLRRGVDDMAGTAIAKTGTRMARNLTGGDVQKSLAEYVSKKLIDEGYAEKAFKEGYRITPEDLAKVQDEILNYVDDSNMLDNLISKLPDDIPDDVIISRIVDPAQRKWPDYIGTKADLLGPEGKRKTQKAYEELFQNLEGPEELLEWMVTGKTPKNLSDDWVKEYGPYIDEEQIGWIIEDSIGSNRVLDPLDRHGIIYEVLPDAVDDPDDFRDFYMKNKDTTYLD